MSNRLTAAMRPKQDVSVTCLVKLDGEKYVFLYRDDQVSEVLQTLNRFACDERLSFTWYDAATLSLKVIEADK